MRHYTALFFVVTVLAVAVAEQDEVPRIATPMTHLLVQDKLHTAMRPGHSSADKTFTGGIMGTMITDFARTNYKGSFNGRTMGKKVKAYFNYRLSGTSTMPGFNVKFNGDSHGVMHAYSKKDYTVRANFDTRMTGTMYKKPLMGRVWGEMRFRLKHAYIRVTERGRFDFMVGGERMVGTYKAFADNKVLKVDIRGFYRGKPFFVRYMFSANVLELIFGGKNPFIVRRNYGTFHVRAGGKKTVKKFDVKGWEIPMVE